MTGDDLLTRADHALIERIVRSYESHKPQISLFRDQLLVALSGSTELNRLIHSYRSRLKDSDHLRDKLRRKMKRSKQEQRQFEVNPENLLVTINDLVGVRILHLHTRQTGEIDAALRRIFDESQYTLLEGPLARTWDDESREFFRACAIQTQDSPSLYTSVHYVINSASRTKVTAEIQLRTLMEEVWGEVDHSMNYPRPTNSLACREQLKVLARVTSGASRLVDSIFATLTDYKAAASTAATAKKPQNRKAASSAGGRAGARSTRPRRH